MKCKPPWMILSRSDFAVRAARELRSGSDRSARHQVPGSFVPGYRTVQSGFIATMLFNRKAVLRELSYHSLDPQVLKVYMQ
jgi:hypothetical protein